MKRWAYAVAAAVFLASSISNNAAAECEIVDGNKKAPFDGKHLENLLVEKKSLTTLNKEFPQLNVIEKTFKGEVQTCSGCTGKHIVCSRRDAES